MSFSGGRDSALVLAAAVAAARRHGLPDPVPVTLRFPGAVAANEDAWQEQLVSQLGLRDWERIALTDELDLCGPVARRVLSSCGVIAPANAHLHLPIAERAAGGVVLTGVGGDGILGGWCFSRTAALLAGRHPPRPRDALGVLHAAAPAVARAALHAIRRRDAVVAPWLSAATRARLRWAVSRDAGSQPLAWPARLRWELGRRYLDVGLSGLGAVAELGGARIAHPLLHPGFVAALARWGGRFGAGNRTATMLGAFGDALPDALLRRRGKAHFGDVFWGARAAAWAGAWNGGGVDPRLVDEAALRALWSTRHPGTQTALLLHLAWHRAGLPIVEPAATQGWSASSALTRSGVPCGVPRRSRR